MEMHISACWHKKFVRHGQRATLVGLQRKFLRQHDVACDEITFGRKAPTNTWTAGAVELVDVHRGAVANPVSLSAMAAGDLKIALRVIFARTAQEIATPSTVRGRVFPFPSIRSKSPGQIARTGQCD